MFFAFQIDVLSQPIWDYAHQVSYYNLCFPTIVILITHLIVPQCDHEELRNVLKQKGSKDGDNEAKSVDLFLRLKCTLTSRGRSVNIKSASYKVSFNLIRWS